MRSTTEPAKIGAAPMAPTPTEGHSPCLMPGRAPGLLLGRAPGLPLGRSPGMPLGCAPGLVPGKYTEPGNVANSKITLTPPNMCSC